MSLRDFLFYEEPGITLYCGDCREVLPLLSDPREKWPDERMAIPSVVITDPPYSIGRSEVEFAASGNIAVALHFDINHSMDYLR